MVFVDPLAVFWHELFALHDAVMLPIEPPDNAPNEVQANPAVQESCIFPTIPPLYPRYEQDVTAVHES